MITELMNKFLSDTLDEKFIDKLDEAKDRGILGDVDFKYVRLPDQTIKVEDRNNGESTIVKKSGSFMIMKSDDSEAIPFSVRSFSRISKSTGFDIDDLIYLFSDSNFNKDNYQTKLFNNFGLKFEGDLTPDKVKSIRKKLSENQRLQDELEDRLEQKESKSKNVTSNELDTQHQENVDERAKLDLDKKKAEEKGLRGVLSKNTPAINGALSEISKIDIKLNKINSEDSKIKDQLDKDKSKDQESNNYKGTTGNKAVETGRKTFSSKSFSDSYFSHSGYENEHTLIIGKLSELKLAPNEHSKSRLLGDLSLLINKINDESISKITKSMLSELKKIKLTDDQYTEIIDDLIESLNTDSVTRMFTMNQATEAGHDIDDEQLMEQTRQANLGQDIHADKMLLKGAALGLGAWGAANGFWGALNPLKNALGAMGTNVSQLANPFNWSKFLPWTRTYKANKFIEGVGNAIHTATGAKNADGSYNNKDLERQQSPVSYWLKAQIPFTQARKNYQDHLKVANGQGKYVNRVNGGLRQDNQQNQQIRSQNIYSPNNQVKK